MVDHSSLPREIIYVDVQRCRSLLGQLSGGVVEQVKALNKDDLQAEAKAQIFGIGAKGAYGKGLSTEESRSLQDLTFSLFEEAADGEGFIYDLPDEAYAVEGWKSGEFQKTLRPGMIVRSFCELRLLDAALFRRRIERFSKMVDALTSITIPVVPGQTPKQRQTARSQAKAALLTGMSDEYLESISVFVENFLGESIAMRALPCGDEHHEFSFSGSLLARAEYIQEERDQLFSRYGAKMGNWVSVMQVTAVPAPSSEDASPEATEIASTESFSRAGFERMSSDLLGMMEDIGLADGPHWPSISVTPLGIYRAVESASGDEALDLK